MIGSAWGLLVVGAMLASATMVALWVLEVRIRDASHVDAAWALLIAACGVVYALLGDGDVVACVCWRRCSPPSGASGSACYLLFDRVLGQEEDGRYQRLRRKWGAHANRRFLWFFQLQAAAVVLFSLPFALMAQDGEEPRPRRWLGSRGLASRKRRRRRRRPATRPLARRSGERREDDACAASGRGRGIRTTSSSG